MFYHKHDVGKLNYSEMVRATGKRLFSHDVLELNAIICVSFYGKHAWIVP
jgi:hypothetical protein